MNIRKIAMLIALTAILSFVALITSGYTHPSRHSKTAGASLNEESVKALLLQQQADWNRGDVTAFMQGYWDSQQLTFAGSTNFTRGWKPVLERYQRSYPDKAAMGHLDFSDLEIRLLGAEAALVLGRWHLTKDSGASGGIFTLVLQHFPEGWRIVHDHTNADPQPKS